MTNDEAIKMIADDMRLHHDYLSGNYRKALNMAIKALRNSPSQIAEKMIDKLPSVQPEPTLEQIKEYCHKRCLSIVDSALLAEYALPSAQPERKQGKWIEVNDAYNRINGRCSVCGWESHLYEDDVVGMDYCPNCGARLEVE